MVIEIQTKARATFYFSHCNVYEIKVIKEIKDTSKHIQEANEKKLLINVFGISYFFY